MLLGKVGKVVSKVCKVGGRCGDEEVVGTDGLRVRWMLGWSGEGSSRASQRASNDTAVVQCLLLSRPPTRVLPAIRSSRAASAESRKVWPSINHYCCCHRSLSAAWIHVPAELSYKAHDMQQSI